MNRCGRGPATGSTPGAPGGRRQTGGVSGQERRLTSVRPVSGASDDPRVRAAAEALAGVDPEEVAERAGVDVGQVLRWAGALAAGGAEAVGGIGVERRAPTRAGTRVPVEEFLAVLAHELRTPLTAARSGLSVLAAEALPEGVRARVAATVSGRLDELDQLTRDLLDVVGLTTGRDRLHPERVDLPEVVREVCAQAGVPLPRVSDRPVVLVDPVRLRTVLSTLLRHAARYADPGSTGVGVSTVPEGALLTVRLPAARLDRDQATGMLDPFGDAARGDGNGLALYVVRSLVVASGGQLGMAGTGPEHPEQAVLWWVRLPLAPVTTPDHNVTAAVPCDAGPAVPLHVAREEDR